MNWHGRLSVSSVYPPLCRKTFQSLYTTANPNLFESFTLGLQMMWFVHRASISKWVFVKAPLKFWCSHHIRYLGLRWLDRTRAPLGVRDLGLVITCYFLLLNIFIYPCLILWCRHYIKNIHFLTRWNAIHWKTTFLKNFQDTELLKSQFDLRRKFFTWA